MPQRQLHTYRKQMTNSQSINNGYGCIGSIFIVILFIIIMSVAVNSLSSPSGQIFLGLFIISLPVFFIWRYYRKKKQQQLMAAVQQQEYEHLQWKRQERELFERQRIEREKQEQERLKRQRIEREKQEQERLKSLGDILTLTPREFEALTGRILVSRGFSNVRLLGGSGDLGADIIGFDRDGKKVIVQCKRYAPGNSVGSPAIQSFIGMMHVHHKAERGIFVTTSTFTLQATDLAKKHHIVLINGDYLVSLVQKMQNNGVNV